jgi:hypothetical protein
MNVAKAASAVVDMVRLYFLVNVRNARGLRVVGGNMIDRTVGDLKFGGGIGSGFLDGNTARGVPNAGEEEGTIGSVASWVFLRSLMARCD